MPAANQKPFWPSLRDSLASVRFTIPLLIILAVASIFGTVIPQNGSPEEYLRVYRVSTYRILKILGFLDMYHVWWFLSLLGLLSLNLVACSLKRLRPVMQFFFPAGVRLDANRWRPEPSVRKFSAPVPPGDGLPAIEEALSRDFTPPRVFEESGARHLFAEKGKLSRLGFFFVHFSILLILAGALIGLLFGFSGYINVAEGETVDRVVSRSGAEMRPLGFKVRLDKFNVSFYPSGAPQEFKSTVTLLEGDREVLTEPIRVNEPLHYKGISFYQSSYGVASVEKVTLTVRDRSSGKEVTVPARMGARTAIPGTPGAFAVSRFLPDLQGAGPAFQVQFMEPGRPVESFWVLQHHPEFDANRSGRYQFRVKEVEPRYYSGLQVARDPGVWVVWAGCFFMMFGFYLAFFTSHRRVWVRITDKKGGMLVEMTGSSHRNRFEFEKELDRIADALKRSLPREQSDFQKKEPGP